MKAWLLLPLDSIYLLYKKLSLSVRLHAARAFYSPLLHLFACCLCVYLSCLRADYFKGWTWSFADRKSVSMPKSAWTFRFLQQTFIFVCIVWYPLIMLHLGGSVMPRVSHLSWQTMGGFLTVSHPSASANQIVTIEIWRETNTGEWPIYFMFPTSWHHGNGAKEWLTENSSFTIRIVVYRQQNNEINNIWLTALLGWHFFRLLWRITYM